LLQQAGITPGFIMVGDREGAVYARLYAWRYPEDVSGLVLIDDPWSVQSAGAISSMSEYGIGFLDLLLNPTWTLPWWWKGKDAIQQWQGDCPTWMDDMACQRWRALSIDPLDMQTEALERFGIPTAMNQSREPGISYGSINLLVVKSPSSNLNASNLQSVYADLLSRSSTGKFWQCPEGDGPVLDRVPECIVAAMRSFLR